VQREQAEKKSSAVYDMMQYMLQHRRLAAMKVTSHVIYTPCLFDIANEEQFYTMGISLNVSWVETFTPHVELFNSMGWRHSHV